MDFFTWALILLAFGMVCLVLEFFVPSSGVLGVLCALSLAGAIVLGFGQLCFFMVKDLRS